MIVISDTSAITNLFQIGEIHLLEKLYGEIIIPHAVKVELEALTPQKKYLENNSWIKIEQPQNQELIIRLLENLDRGESEAIALAIEKSADYILMDEFRGRETARSYNLEVIGVLGILISAKKSGLIEKVKPLLDKLMNEVNFFIHPKLYKDVLFQVGEND